MVTKAIVEEIVSRYKIRVRMPFFDGASEMSGSTSFDNLKIATLCNPSGVYQTLRVGDVVIVAFEDGWAHKPLIIGKFFIEDSTVDFNNESDIFLSSININSYATLPYNTKIGNVEAKDISNLQNTNSNIQEQLNALEARIKILEEDKNKQQKSQ